MTITLAAQIAEVAREIAMRRRVYPRQVARGAMRQAEADHLIATMEAVRDSLLRLAALDAAGPLSPGEDG